MPVLPMGSRRATRFSSTEILIGFVSGVSAHDSVVQTIFDPNFKLPVRIGAQDTMRFWSGGSYPMAESIAKTAVVAAGDVVYSAAPGMPYAIPVGTVRERIARAEQSF